MNPRGPDYGVAMHDVKVTTGDGFSLRVNTGEKREGLLGSLGVGETRKLDPMMCPECALVRLYADVEE